MTQTLWNLCAPIANLKTNHPGKDCNWRDYQNCASAISAISAISAASVTDQS
jgi:hypothetical protein